MSCANFASYAGLGCAALTGRLLPEPSRLVLAECACCRFRVLCLPLVSYNLQGLYAFCKFQIILL